MADPAVDNLEPTTTPVATLSVAAVRDACPPLGSEMAHVYNLRIAWVRDALDILGIALTDRNDHGECKAALARYYQDLNESRQHLASHHAPGGPDYAALCQQVSDLQRQLQALQTAGSGSGPTTVTAASGDGPNPGAAASGGGPPTGPATLQSRRARGVLLLNAPKPDKAAASDWKAPRHPKPASLAKSLTSLMGLIGQPWSDRTEMLASIAEGILLTYPEGADLGIPGDSLEGIHLAICHGTADTSAPLVQAILHSEGEYSATFVHTLTHACAELPEDHPLCCALVDLDSHARVYGTSDSYWWLLKRFLAFAAPPGLDKSTYNNREVAMLTTSVYDATGGTFRAALEAIRNEKDEIVLGRRSFGLSSSLQDDFWSLYFREILKRSPSSSFVKGALATFEDDAKHGRTPTDQDVMQRFFHFASHLDAAADAERAARSRASQPQVDAATPTPKATGRAAEDTTPKSLKDQRPGTLKRAHFTGRPVLASDLSESAYRRVMQLGNCFKCGAKGHRSSECTNPPACAICAGVEAPKSHASNDCPRLSAQKNA